MTTPNCRHRKSNAMLGVHHEEGQGNCPICEYEEEQKDKAFFLFCVAAVAVVLVVGAFVMGWMS